MHDLLETAARLLVVGGRLVYFLAAAPGFYSEEEVPQHPMLEVRMRSCSWRLARLLHRVAGQEEVQCGCAAAAELPACARQ